MAVINEQSKYVELYVDGEFWQSIFIEDSVNYTLPIPTVDGKFFVEYEDLITKDRYTFIDGIGIKEIGKCTQLNAVMFDSSYTLITSAEQLKSVTGNKNYVLGCDIDLGGNAWTPIASFSGVFDGNGHIISNFKLTSTGTYNGFFAVNSGTIKNLGLENYIATNLDPNNDYMGALVAMNSGYVINCYSTCDISYNYPTYGGYSGNNYSVRVYVGGLVGFNGGTVSGCYTTGNVSCTLACASLYGYDTPYTYAGGVVGQNGGTLSNSFAIGNVTSNSESKTAESGDWKAVSSYGYAGHVACNGTNGVIENCYYKSEQTVKRTGKSGSVYTKSSALTIAELQSSTVIFETLKWDSTIWVVENGYPKLK